MRLKEIIRFIVLAGVLFCTIGASADEMYVSRCNGEFSLKGQCFSVTGTISNAAKFTPDLWAPVVGNDITGVQVGISRSHMSFPESVTVWVRESLDGENLASASVAVNGTEGWKVGKFAAPIKVEADKTYYVGYSYEQVKEKPCFIISVVGNCYDGGWHVNLGGGWNDLSNGGYGGLSVEAIVEGDNLPQNNLAMADVELGVETLVKGDELPVSMTVRNIAAATQQGFVLEYTLGGKTTKVEYDDELVYRGSKNISLAVPTEGLDLKANEQLQLKLLCADGSDDEYMEDNIASLAFQAISKGYSRNVVLEQFSTENCVMCPGGTKTLVKAIESLKEDSVRAYWITHHAGFGTDWLSVKDSETYTWFYGGAGTYAPAYTVNRTYFPTICNEPYPVTGVGNVVADITKVLTGELGKIVPVALEMEVVKQADGKYNIQVNGERASEFAEICANPRLTVMITEDGIAARMQNGAAEGYVHNHVLRQVCSATWGDDIAWNDDSFSKTYTLTPGEGWNMGNVSVVAFISTYDADDCNACKIINSAACAVADGASAVETVANDTEVVATCWVDASGRECQYADMPGIWVRVDTLADGSTKATKVVVK